MAKKTTRVQPKTTTEIRVEGPAVTKKSVTEALKGLDRASVAEGVTLAQILSTAKKVMALYASAGDLKSRKGQALAIKALVKILIEDGWTLEEIDSVADTLVELFG